MSYAVLLLPPSVPRSVIWPSCHRNACKVGSSGVIVLRPTTWQEALIAGNGFHLYGSAVPAGLVKPRVVNSAFAALRRKRHLNLRVPLHIRGMGNETVGINGKIPTAVERLPVCALELRTWISVGHRACSY